MTAEMDHRFHAELNFRDLGGYPTKDGRIIKKGLFYRSGGLSFMTPQELETFNSLGIQCVIDFRTETENQKHPDPLLPMEVYRCSGVVSKGGEGIDFSPKGMFQIGENGERQLQVLTKYYEEMPFQNEAFRFFMEQVKNNHVPICIHCATGKDRTGVASMILLLLLGVDEETVLKDYLMSCDYRREILDETLRKNAAKIQKSPVLKELLIMKDGVSETIGRQVLKNMKKRYGSFEAYLWNEFELDKEQIQQIRDRYLILYSI